MLISRMKNGGPEIFATVQGEGPSVGVPSIFVRLADCNLRCSWCDTKYTWDWTHYERSLETLEHTAADIEERVLELANDATRNIIFTGGEPLLQQDELAGLAARMKAHSFRIEVETNGTIRPNDELAASVDQWNVSPKLASSGNSDRARHRASVLEWFASRSNAVFKFVVGSDADVTEVVEIGSALGVPRERLILSPEGTDAVTLAERSRWLAEKCGAHGYRLGTRLHVFLWGSERGR